MAELGINVLDMNGNLRDMGEVMEEIGGKWGDLTREQQVYLAQTMAGQRQYNNLLALFDNFEQYNKALNTAQNAAGTLQKQQDIHMESTAAHLEVLKASVEDIFDSFVNRDSLDTVNDLIDALSDGAMVIAKFVDSLGGGVNILSSLGSLGITVFSKQIAGSIQTTINNLN
ncbi:MAG: phage tail tape measure protein [Methanosphaera sp.]|nr:phage tail tape measure protein [Methanosphaera sp.]